MKYSDALFFVGKCLSLGRCPERTDEVRARIQSGLVAWEKIVWVSTNHYVFPAMYLQLKRAGLLPELPVDLVEYMEEYTGANRERNRQIIRQAHEIEALLNHHEITPVFLKGTAHLLDGLYEDIAERMVGDIDFLVHENDMVRVAEILIKNGYKAPTRFNPLDLKRIRHYPLLVNDNRRAAVEIHWQVIRIPYQYLLDYELIAKNSRRLNQLNAAYVPMDEHQILQNILSVQLNDDGYYYAAISLRQSYDLLLLSLRKNPLTVVKKFGKFFHCLNANLALSNKLFGDPGCLPYQPTWLSRIFLSRIMRHINNPGWARFSRFVLYMAQRIFNNFKLLALSIFNKNVRQSIFARLTDLKWYGEHLRSYKSG
jgi:hypothetical protein